MKLQTGHVEHAVTALPRGSATGLWLAGPLAAAEYAPDSLSGRRAHQRDVLVPVGATQPSIAMIDMAALAARKRPSSFR